MSKVVKIQYLFPEDPEFKKLIAKIDWASVTNKLVLYASQRLQRLYWRGELGGEAPSGMQAKDFAQDAIKKVLEGARRLYIGATETDVYWLLVNTIRSATNHEAVNVENSLSQRLEELSFSLLTPSPYQDTTLEQINHDLAKDPELLMLVQIMVDISTKPADIAIEMGVEIDYVYNLMKKLRRRLSGFNKPNSNVLPENNLGGNL